MDTAGLVVYAIASFFVSVLGGMSGGGGGFIMTPLTIFLGLSPAQAVATGKLGGLSVTLGSLHGLRKAKLHSWKVVVPISLMALVIGVVAPLAIVNLDAEVYKRTLGVLLLLMVPIMLFKKVGHQKREVSKGYKIAGYTALAVAMSLQAVFSGGLGTLVNMALMGLLGMSALEANVTKRFSQVVLNGVISLALIGTDLIVWEVALVGAFTAFLGGVIGAHLAIKKGDVFVTRIFVIFMIFAAAELLLG